MFYLCALTTSAVALDGSSGRQRARISNVITDQSRPLNSNHRRTQWLRTSHLASTHFVRVINLPRSGTSIDNRLREKPTINCRARTDDWQNEIVLRVAVLDLVNNRGVFR